MEKKPYIYHIPQMDLCSFNFWVPVGQIHDPDDRIGLTHLIEHLLFTSHPDYSQHEIMQWLETKGCIFNGVTEKEGTCLYGRVPKEHLNEVLEFIISLIKCFHPTEESIQEEIRTIYNEIDQSKFILQYNIIHRTYKNLFKNSSYGISFLDKTDIVEITKKEIKDFYSEHYHLSYWRLIVLGNIRESDLSISLPKTPVRPNYSTPSFNSELSIVEQLRTETLPKGYAALSIAFRFEKNIEEYQAKVIQNALFEGLSSPFYNEIVKKKNLSYSLYSNVSSYHSFNTCYVYWLCSQDNLQSSIDISRFIFDHVFEYLDKNVIESGLKKTLLELLLIRENYGRLSHHMSKAKALHNKDMNIDQQIKSIKDLTFEDYLSIASDMFKQSMLYNSFISQLIKNS